MLREVDLEHGKIFCFDGVPVKFLKRVHGDFVLLEILEPFVKNLGGRVVQFVSGELFSCRMMELQKCES